MDRHPTLAPALAGLVDVLKALADPVRLDLLVRVVAVPQMPCTAGLVEVYKQGRNDYYVSSPGPAGKDSGNLRSGHRSRTACNFFSRPPFG